MFATCFQIFSTVSAAAPALSFRPRSLATVGGPVQQQILESIS